MGRPLPQESVHMLNHARSVSVSAYQQEGRHVEACVVPLSTGEWSRPIPFENFGRILSGSIELIKSICMITGM